MTPFELVLLYLAFRAKQFTCDYLLQSKEMVEHKAAGLGAGTWRALAMHAGIHAAFTFLIVVLFAPTLWWLGAVDFIIHAAIDRTKSIMVARHNWTPQDTRYWWAYGLDQEAHNLTHLAYIVAMVIVAGGLVASGIKPGT